MHAVMVYHPGAKKLDKITGNYTYFDDFMKIALDSLKLTNPDIQLHVVILGEGKVNYKNVSITYAPFRGTYFESFQYAEFEIWKELSKKGLVMATDIDVLFRKRIDQSLFAKMDVGFLYSPGERIWSKFNKGILFFNNRSIEFLEEWEKEANIPQEGDRLDQWFKMQLSSYKVFKRRKDLQFYHLPVSYNDGKLGDSAIWHANLGSKYEKLLKFKKEIALMRASQWI